MKTILVFIVLSGIIASSANYINSKHQVDQMGPRLIPIERMTSVERPSFAYETTAMRNTIAIRDWMNWLVRKTFTL